MERFFLELDPPEAVMRTWPHVVVLGRPRHPGRAHGPNDCAFPKAGPGHHRGEWALAHLAPIPYTKNRIALFSQWMWQLATRQRTVLNWSSSLGRRLLDEQHLLVGG